MRLKSPCADHPHLRIRKLLTQKANSFDSTTWALVARKSTHERYRWFLLAGGSKRAHAEGANTFGYDGDAT